MSRKQTTPILNHAKNGGMHRQPQWRQISAMLDGHGYRRPRLYHITLLPECYTVDAKPFLRAIKALCLRLRTSGAPTRWRAALERDEEKGLHMHVFLLVDAIDYPSDRIINEGVSDPMKPPRKKGEPPKTPDGWMRELFKRNGLGLYLCCPQGDMHRTQDGRLRRYAMPTTPEKIADCRIWLSYLVKARSKPDDVRGIYYSSKDSLRATGGRLGYRKEAGKGTIARSPQKPHKARSNAIGAHGNGQHSTIAP